MKDILRISGRLAIICAVAAIALAFVNAFTAPEIAAYQERVLLEALSAVAGDYTVGEGQDPDDEMISASYVLMDSQGSISGMILKIRALGYGGPMGLLVGYENDGTVIGVRLLENAETPGLGKEAEKDAYMEKFLGKGGSSGKIPQRKSDLAPAAADQISGATITFTGIAKALDYGAIFVKSMGGAK